MATKLTPTLPFRVDLERRKAMYLNARLVLREENKNYCITFAIDH